MKNTFKAVALVGLSVVLASCDRGYDYKNPKTVDDVVLLFLMQQLVAQPTFGVTPSEKQSQSYMDCITPIVPVARARLSAEEVKIIEDDRKIRSEDPDASRPDMDFQLAFVMASVFEKNMKETNNCARGAGLAAGPDPKPLPPSDPVQTDLPATDVPVPVQPTAPAAATDDQNPATVAIYSGPFTPSFDCSKASSGQEKMVCSDRDLAKLDVTLHGRYVQSRDRAADKKAVLDRQRAWIKNSFNACSDKACLVAAYNSRIAELGN